MAKTLITGGLGFIGRNLVEYLTSRGEQPTLIVRDSQIDLVSSEFESNIAIVTESDFVSGKHLDQVDTVINLAGFYSFGDSPHEAQKLIKDNIEFPAKILSTVALHNPQAVWIQASTFMQHFRSAEYEPTCLYAATKQAMIDVLRYYSANGLVVHNIVLPQVYGNNDTRTKIINLLIKACKHDETIEISSGHQIIDLVHVDDVVRAIVQLRSQKESTKTQLTSRESLTLRDLVSLIEKSSGKKLKVEFNIEKDRKRDAYEKWLVYDVPLGWSQEVELDTWITQQFRGTGK